MVARKLWKKLSVTPLDKGDQVKVQKYWQASSAS